MPESDFYNRLFTYDEWANAEMMTALRDASAPGNTLPLMAHVAAALRLWLVRAQGGDETVEVWPRFTIAQCAAQLTESSRMWRAYIDALSLESLENRVAYTNTKGNRFESTLADMMMHVIVHAAYHRAQVAAELRAAGVTPPYTDFIHAAREKKI